MKFSIIFWMVAMILASATQVRVRVWQSNVTLWHDAVAKAPTAPRSLWNYGMALEAVHDPIAPQWWDQAQACAARRWPEVPAQWVWKMAAWQRGKLWAARNESAQAIAAFNDMARVPTGADAVHCADRP